MPSPLRDTLPAPSLRAALPVWVRVALLSFGGPAGQIAVMQRILVDEKRWISQDRFLHALNFCMLLPGPEAQQLATYIGWLLHRWRGGLVAGTLFVLPGFLSILALSIAYALLRDAPLVAGLFFGIKAAVLAIVLQALVRIARHALHRRVHLALAAAAFLAIYFFGVPFPLIIAGAALVGLADGRLTGEERRPAPAARAAGVSLRGALGTASLWLAIWWLPVAALWLWLGAGHTLVREAIFFSQTAVVTFGGAYAVLAYVAQQAVETYGWLQPGEMLDGLGMAETTPGPLIQVVQFVGFMGALRDPAPFSPLAAALLGSVVTTWVTFTPCFLWIFTGAPFVESLRGRPLLRAALAAITAAVVGVILNLSVWFAVHTLFAQTATLTGPGIEAVVPVPASVRPVALLIALLCFVLLLRLRWGMLRTLAFAATAGALWALLAG